MKYLIYGLVVFAAALCVAESQQLVDTLIKRAEEIVKKAKADLERFNSTGKGHLVTALEREIQMVENIEKDLKALPQGTTLELQHIHQIEERLLRHENTLSEEVARIEAHNDKDPHERHELEARALLLLERAKLDLERIQKSGNSSLAQLIAYQTMRIEEIVYELRTHPNSTLEGEQPLRIEQRLAEHERVLAEELKLIESY